MSICFLAFQLARYICLLLIYKAGLYAIGQVNELGYVRVPSLKCSFAGTENGAKSSKQKFKLSQMGKIWWSRTKNHKGISHLFPGVRGWGIVEDLSCFKSTIEFTWPLPPTRLFHINQFLEVPPLFSVVDNWSPGSPLKARWSLSKRSKAHTPPQAINNFWSLICFMKFL